MNPSVLFTYARASTSRLVAREAKRGRNERRVFQAGNTLRIPVVTSFSSFSFFFLVPLCVFCSSLHLQSRSRFLPCKFARPSLALHRHAERVLVAFFAVSFASFSAFCRRVNSLNSITHFPPQASRVFTILSILLLTCRVYDRFAVSKRNVKPRIIASPAADDNLRFS